MWGRVLAAMMPDSSSSSLGLDGTSGDILLLNSMAPDRITMSPADMGMGRGEGSVR